MMWDKMKKLTCTLTGRGLGEIGTTNDTRFLKEFPLTIAMSVRRYLWAVYARYHAAFVVILRYIMSYTQSTLFRCFSA